MPFEFHGSDLEDPSAQADFIVTLGAIGDEDPDELGDAPDSYSNAIKKIAEEMPELALTILQSCIANDSPSVRAFAAISAEDLLDSRPDEAFELVKTGFNDKDKRVGRAVVGFWREYFTGTLPYDPLEKLSLKRYAILARAYSDAKKALEEPES